MSSNFPLRQVTTAQLQQLTILLWEWGICIDCLEDKPCVTEECPWPRATILSRFFEFYKDLTASYESELKIGQQPGITCHEELFKIVQRLKEDPQITKRALLESTFKSWPVRDDQERAINLAVRILMMVNCSALRQSSTLLEYGNFQASWLNDTPFSQFIFESFPMTDHPSIDDIKENLRGRKLKKRSGLRFQPTDDLRNHLKLDRKTATVEIFHHTTFLKEQLRLTKKQPRNISVADSIRLGALPRALALEALDSVQQILFPLTDAKSKSLLRSLTSTSTCNFDPDILRYDSTSIRNPDEKVISYHYFGARLAELYEEMENPTPRGLEKWFERKSGARYVMMATFAGVIFAIFLGIASLALGGYQAWVGYQQWQHPIRT